MGELKPHSVTIPAHVAIIMDGNGRWAHARSLPRSEGHRQGVEAVRRAVRSACDLGIRYLTIYSFSSENWARPKSEVNDLLGLLRRFVRQDVAELHSAGVRVKVIGDRSELASDIVDLLEESENLTAGNTGLTLVVAFNYGGRQELALALRRVASEVEAGMLTADQVNVNLLSRYLDTYGIPDPDLLIRTSGEQRISNFLLWQLAYTEFVFIEEHWPEFDHDIFLRALCEYSGRERRFGGLTAQAV